ncbi:hypothetical protein ACQ86K_17335 [Mucilaginibacter sp. P19]|uniref:hypothetical protein n=1 Tax=Mucilaginibacter TaxID=423349 RepID=UPI000B85B0A9|nr:hypothetical protein [Mucilaginibacter gossypii]
MAGTSTMTSLSIMVVHAITQQDIMTRRYTIKGIIVFIVTAGTGKNKKPPDFRGLSYNKQLCQYKTVI